MNGSADEADRRFNMEAMSAALRATQARHEFAALVAEQWALGRMTTGDVTAVFTAYEPPNGMTDTERAELNQPQVGVGRYRVN